MSVVDASVILDLLVPPSAARRDFVIAQLPEPAQPWLAPDVLPFEVFAVIRRHLLRGAVSLRHAEIALHRLRRLPIELVPTLGLLDIAWTLRDRFSAADALYASLAMRAGEVLLTSDLRLAVAAKGVSMEVLTPSS